MKEKNKERGFSRDGKSRFVRVVRALSHVVLNGETGHHVTSRESDPERPAPGQPDAVSQDENDYNVNDNGCGDSNKCGDKVGEEFFNVVIFEGGGFGREWASE